MIVSILENHMKKKMEQKWKPGLSGVYSVIWISYQYQYEAQFRQRALKSYRKSKPTIWVTTQAPA